jgi:hypothetical protein
MPDAWGDEAAPEAAVVDADGVGQARDRGEVGQLECEQA